MTTTDIIEGEVVGRELTVAPQANVALFGTTDPVEIVGKARDVANALKDVIKQQGLITNIQGKEYVQVGGWTLLGSMLGVFPVLEWCRRLDNGWEARVQAQTLSGAIVGAAEAECTRDERMWSGRDDYAIRSMAQTRATSKALRMPLGFVVTLAGFQATPAEEMIGVNDERPKMRGGAQRQVPQVEPPSCPDHGVCRFVPAGIGKKSDEYPDGKPYEAFYSCRDKTCKRGSKGKGFYVHAQEWFDNQEALKAARSDEQHDYDDVPNE